MHLHYIHHKLWIYYIGRSEDWPHPSTPLVFECREHLGECGIRLGYTSFLTTIVFKRVGSSWGPISSIRTEVTSLNHKGVIRGEIVGRSEGWSCPSTFLVFECCECLGECTKRLGYAYFLISIVFRRVGSVWGPTITIRPTTILHGLLT